MKRINNDVLLRHEDLKKLHKCVKYINENGITGIDIHFADEKLIGMNQVYDFDFLLDINSQQIQKICLYSKIKNCDIFYRFAQLKSLAFTPEDGGSLDLLQFPNLKSLKTYDTDSYINLEQTKLNSLMISGKFDSKRINQIISLRELILSEVKGFSFKLINDLVKLVEFRASQIGMINFEGVEAFHNLVYLQVIFSRSLLDISGVAKLNKLETMHLENCPKLTDISEIARCSSLKKLYLGNLKNCDLAWIERLKNLEEFRLTNCGNIPTLKFIEKMYNLQAISFVDTNVLDGDLRPCFRLKAAGTLDKRHYNVKSEDLPKIEFKLDSSRGINEPYEIKL